MSYLLRVVLPDQPGSLGALATALGRVDADILSVDVVERSPGYAVDDLVIELPADRLADSLVTAAMSLRGVAVESIRTYAGHIDTHRELELVDAISAAPGDAAQLLADGLPRIFRAGWAMVVRLHPEHRPIGETGRDAPLCQVIARSSAAPEIDTLPAPWWPLKRFCLLDVTEPWAPREWDTLGTELAATPFGDAAVLIGRPGGLGWRASELVRINHLTGIAASVS
ncbi:MAG: amino acid-binding protein [Frankiaceae bacterium]|jgi:hypothetical protein|nr:amino acid-binding protein [Frankiaceae bacterium]